MIFNFFSGVNYDYVACFIIVKYITKFNTLFQCLVLALNYASHGVFIYFKPIFVITPYSYHFVKKGI